MSIVVVVACTLLGIAGSLRIFYKTRGRKKIKRRTASNLSRKSAVDVSGKCVKDEQKVAAIQTPNTNKKSSETKKEPLEPKTLLEPASKTFEVPQEPSEVLELRKEKNSKDSKPVVSELKGKDKKRLTSSADYKPTDLNLQKAKVTVVRHNYN